MPNWVTTRLYVEGPKNAVDEFYRAMVVAGNFTFEGILPMPEALRGTTRGTISDIGVPLLEAIEQQMGGPHPKISSAWREKLVGGRVEPFYISAQRFLDQNPEYREAAELGIKAKAETGFADWYEWSINNWGTKWDACSSSVNETSPGYLDIQFDTAWSFPSPVFEALEEAYPTLTFEGTWQDECDDEATDFYYHKEL